MATENLMTYYYGEKVFTLPLQPAQIIGANDPIFTVGISSSFEISDIGSPTPTLTEVGSIPAGISFDNGLFSGTASVGTGGLYPISLSAQNSIGYSNSKSIQLTVLERPSFINSAPTGTAFNSPFTFDYSVNGYPVPTFTLGSGTLPSGLALSGGGVLTGTPNTSGTYSARVDTTNSLGVTGQSFSFLVV